jgi:TPR repeat protein
MPMAQPLLRRLINLLPRRLINSTKMIFNMKRCKTLLFFLLLNFSFTVSAAESSLDERFKAAELLEASNPVAAFPLYQELVEQNYTEAKVRLAALLSAGLGDKGTEEENFHQSVKLLHEAADEGSIKAYYGLYVMNHGAASLTPDSDVALSWLIKAAKAGEPRGQSQLGYFYDKGVIVKQDIKKAIYWYKEAIKNNSDKARYNLASLYLDGQSNAPQKIKEAISLYLVSAKNGHDHSKVALGNIYMDDAYGLKDVEKAFYWLNAAASNGNTYGQTGLASCYRYGVGTDIDYEKALYWYQLSADASHSPTSRYRLAEMHMLGLGTKVDLNKAREFFLQLSQEGYADGTTAVAQVDNLIAEKTD